MVKEIVRVHGGFTDVHVHFREPGATHKEDFASGTEAATAGGFSGVVDMPNNPEPTISPLSLQSKIDLASGRIVCDVGFNFGANAASSEYFERLKDQYFGVKLYMTHTTGPLLVEDGEDLDTVFKATPQNKLILVHVAGEKDGKLVLEKAVSLAQKYHKKLHVCHVSTRHEIERIRALKEGKMPITCEVTPHHLFLTRDDLPKLGSFGLMQPPLGTKDDRDALWANLDVIDIIASDHAPHTNEEKLSSEKPPFGVPGLETSIPLMLTAVANKWISLERMIEMTSTKPRELFGIVQQPDTYTEIDLKESYVIDSSNHRSKAGWNPFNGMRVTGKVVKVVLRGKVVFDGENIKGKPSGKLIYPG